MSDMKEDFHTILKAMRVEPRTEWGPVRRLLFTGIVVSLYLTANMLARLVLSLDGGNDGRTKIQ